MKLRPIEASCQVANKTTIKTERPISSVCGDAVALIAETLRTKRSHPLE